MSTKQKLLLAYSGGLDTSYCAIYLADEGFEVHSVFVNTGGYSQEELNSIERNALDLGVASHQTLDVQDEYYRDCVRYMIYGNILKNGTYPLSVSSERTVQAISIVNYAKANGFTHIGHGCTGAGNDQIRFDLVFQVLAPEIEVLTPIRDLKLSRQQEIDYLVAKGVQRDWTKMAYSINRGLWGTSIGGKETLTSSQGLPEEAYPTQVQRDGTETITLGFVKGELVEVNGEKLDSIAAILRVEEIAAPYGVGRDIHVGDTIIGIKGRVAFEAAAPMVIIKGHHALEKHVLTKWQLHWKEQLANWYGMFLHEAQYLEPVMRDIEKFLESSQQHVTGKVFVKLRPYSFMVEGIESANDLMNPTFAEYGESNKRWTSDDAKGFTTVLSTPLSLYYHTHRED
jgi:argininosuccinate synthase